MTLRDYARKRRFTHTPEPADDALTRKPARGQHRPTFVVQLHNARARHYDFRLEADGALKSWAVPRGPSLRAGEKRLAVEVEDHPIAYGGFEGEIPQGNYGAGHVLVFDRGVWSCDGDPLEAIATGKLDFTLEGGKLRGGWKLIRTSKPGRGGKPQWLLVKRDDRFARDAEADDLVEIEPDAAFSAAIGRQWISGEGERKATKSKDKAERQASKPAKPHAPKSPVRRQDATWKRRALAIEGARNRELPAGFKPELATLREHAPRGEDWLHEVKWDGYRMLADLVDGKVKLRSRNNLDWTGDFPAIAAAIEALPVTDAHLDGELVALGDGGASDFALLQRTLHGKANASLHYVVFDLPGFAGADLSGCALLERKRLLETLLRGADHALLYSQHVVGHGEDVFAASATHGLEGIISKHVDAHYTQRRSSQWIKVKHAQGDEFVIVGYSAPQGTRSGFGALLLATPAGDEGLRYVGRVGTGFNDDTLRSLLAKMQPLARKTPSIVLPDHLPHDKRDRGNITWLKPVLVAEVTYRGWGKDGLLRQASFQRLRIDKTVEDLLMHAPRKTPAKGSGKKTGATASTTSATARAPRRRTKDASADVDISSRDRVVFKDPDITKGEIADYYTAVAHLILPGLKDRPLSLLRCPGGVAGQCFFQKHHADALGGHVHSIELGGKSGNDDYLYISDAAGLLELTQMNTIEFHPWGSRIDQPEKPDTLVFDLDPGPGVMWKQVIAGARDVRARLRDAGLESFVRLSGGKGVHVVVPIRRGPSWDKSKDFCSAFAEAMAAHKPLSYVATMSKAKRDGRIFIDWLRNGRGATSVCSWSLRAREGAPVAMPVTWEELGRVGKPDAFDLRKALKRAKTLKADPWEGYATAARQALPKLD